MAIGLYKPGQGYWVRVLTATLIGVVTLAAAAWMYNQMGLVADKLPRSVWAVPYAQGAAAPVAGEPVTLIGKGTDSSAGPEMGTAKVETYSAGASELRINEVQMKDPLTDPSQAAFVKVGAGQPLPIKGTVKGETAINPLLLQGFAMAIVLLAGAVLAYYFAAVHQRFVDFLIATDGEMKKVNWSTRRDIRMSTMVVIFASVMLAASLFIADFAFQWLFKTIGVLAS
jgi:preprotein translocase SecE subunit